MPLQCFIESLVTFSCTPHRISGSVVQLIANATDVIFNFFLNNAFMKFSVSFGLHSGYSAGQ